MTTSDDARRGGPPRAGSPATAPEVPREQVTRARLAEAERRAETAERRLAEARHRWSTLIEESEAAITVLALADGTVLEANPVARLVSHLTEADVAAGVRLPDVMPEPGASQLRGKLARFAARGAGEVEEALGVTPEHATTPIQARFTLTHWDGDPAVLLEVRDRTDHLALAARTRELELLEQHYRQAFSEAAIGMALVSVGPDPEPGTFLEVNRAMCDLVGRDAEDLSRHTFTEISHPDDVQTGLDVFRSVTTGEVARGVVEKRYLHSAGHEVWARVTVSQIRGPDGSPLHLVAQAEDITARKAAEAELLHGAMHDPLTDLPNRAHLMLHLDRALARAARVARLVGVMYIDVDDFKDVNDSLGHAAGDEVLVALARRVVDVLRGGDIAARLGGDEMVLVCEDLAVPADIEPLAARVVEAIQAPLLVANHVLHLTASVGAATGGAGSTSARLVRDADAAMYRAKRGGKARYEVGDSALAALAVRQIEVYDDLHRALENGELRLVYQPIVEARSGRIVATEALLRWQHPTRGLLGPGAFIDVAESRELIVPIGTWVLEEATRQTAAWARVLGDAAPSVWVNVSERQVGRHNLTAAVARALELSGLPAAQLGIELTERAMVQTTDLVRADLSAIRDFGVRLAIDDFGTGRTGIDYLREIPISALKIDMTFVAGLGVDRTNTALTDALITLGHGLGLTLTAEGVETEEQLAMLRAWGCDHVQGFLLGRPQDPDAVLRTLVAGAPPSGPAQAR